MITDPKELLLSVLHAKDASRDRSTQTQVGPSEIGGCRRKVWYRLNSQPHTNDNQSGYTLPILGQYQIQHRRDHRYRCYWW